MVRAPGLVHETAENSPSRSPCLASGSKGAGAWSIQQDQLIRNHLGSSRRWLSIRAGGARTQAPAHTSADPASAGQSPPVGAQAPAQQGPLSCPELAFCHQLHRILVRVQGAHRHWSLGLALPAKVNAFTPLFVT